MSNPESDPGRAASDELAVRTVVARLAQYADGLGTIDEYVDLFTPAARWLMPGAPRIGQAEIRAGAEERRAGGTVGPGSNSRHVITTTAVAFETPDRAVADSYWMFVVDTDSTPVIRSIGTYRDTVIRTSEGWKLDEREVSFG